MTTQHRAFRPLAATQNVAVTTSSQSITFAYTAGTRAVRLMNSGTDTIFIEMRNSGATAAAAATSMPMLPNSVEVFTISNETTSVQVIGVTGGVSTLYVTVGEGL